MDAASENPTLYADLTEPQSLNKYQYCYNNPLSFIDIDGHKGWREWLKTGLEVASYVPGPIGAGASLVQAGIAVAQGDYKGAALAAAGAIPGGKILAKVGAAVATVAVAAAVVRKVAKAADKAADVGKAIGKVTDGANASNKALAIGKLSDLKKPGTLKPSEYRLDWADKGSPKANWKENDRLLRQEMRTGRPIRDVSVDANGNRINNTGFLRAERNRLKNNGWTYNSTTQTYQPTKELRGMGTPSSSRNPRD